MPGRVAPSWRETGPWSHFRVVDVVSSGAVTTMSVGVQLSPGSQVITVCAVPPGLTTTAVGSSPARGSE